MAWIESHQVLRDHPKVKRLARLLDCSVAATIGHLHCLWWWAMDYAEDGDTARYDALDIADACMWEGDPDQLVEALRGCGPGGTSGFLDGTVLHDWDEYGGKLAAKRRKDRVRKREARSTPDVQGTSDGQDTDVQRTSSGQASDVQRLSEVEERRGEDSREEESGDEQRKLSLVEPPKTKTKAKRATQLPASWKPNEAHRELAAERSVDLDLAADKFRDHAAANERTLKDWDAGFRNWLRNERPSQSRGRPAHAASDATAELNRYDEEAWK